jgi:hypothetical protein
MDNEAIYELLEDNHCPYSQDHQMNVCVSNVTKVLTRTNVQNGERTSDNAAENAYVISLGLGTFSCDEKGHLIGTRFGGRARSFVYNLIPLYICTN